MKEKWIIVLMVLLTAISSCKDDAIKFPPSPVIKLADGENINIGDKVTIIVEVPETDLQIGQAWLDIDGRSRGLSVHAPYTFTWETARESLGDHIIKTGIVAAGGATTNAELKVEIGIDGEGGGNDIEFVYVAGGSFMMGRENTFEEDEQPVHKVTLNGFEISRYEITNLQYCEFLNDIECNSSGRYNGISYINLDGSRCQINYTAGKFISETDKENFPVVEISWCGANTYANWSGGRLPTEAQWEFAARGGVKSKNYLYSGSDVADEVAWYAIHYNVVSHQVGSLAPNELGIYDMSGNVREMCYDGYNMNQYENSEELNPEVFPWDGPYVVRGGSWFDGAYACRTTRRFYTYGGNGASMNGFRVAR